MKEPGVSLGQSLDLPALDSVDTLAQELALLQDQGKRRIAILGSRHVPVVAHSRLHRGGRRGVGGSHREQGQRGQVISSARDGKRAPRKDGAIVGRQRR